MCRSGTKVWVVEAHEDMKMGQVRLLTVEAKEGDLIAYGRAWAAIKKISGCGVSFGPVGGRHGRMEESAHYVVDGAQAALSLHGLRLGRSGRDSRMGEMTAHARVMLGRVRTAERKERLGRGGAHQPGVREGDAAAWDQGGEKESARRRWPCASSAGRSQRAGDGRAQAARGDRKGEEVSARRRWPRTNSSWGQGGGRKSTRRERRWSRG
jgi:hypothetical protein